MKPKTFLSIILAVAAASFFTIHLSAEFKAQKDISYGPHER